jgi:ABC-type multidrug transport system fused ATPase/permease subunit
MAEAGARPVGSSATRQNRRVDASPLRGVILCRAVSGQTRATIAGINSSTEFTISGAIGILTSRAPCANLHSRGRGGNACRHPLRVEWPGQAVTPRVLLRPAIFSRAWRPYAEGSRCEVVRAAMSDEESKGRPISAPFAAPDRLRSRDIFRLLSRAWPFIRPYRADLIRLFVMLLPGAAAGLAGLILVRIFFDVIGNGQPLSPSEAWLLHLPASAARQTILTRACIVGGVAALAGLPYALFVLGYGVWVVQRISNLFRVNLFAQFQELSLSFHSEEKIGDAMFRMFQDSAGIPLVINGLVMRPLRVLPMAVVNLGWLAIFNYEMALIALILLPAEFALAWAFGAPLRVAFLNAREATALATTRIEETLASIKAVKAFGREEHEAMIFADENWASLLAERKARTLWLIYRVLSNFLRGLAYLAVIYIGARQAVTGQAGGIASSALSLGLFQALVIAFDRIAGGAHGMAMTWGSLQDVGVAFARVFQILRLESERMSAPPQNHRGNSQPPLLRQVLTFDHVSFAYPEGTPALSGIDFEAQTGELTAVVGPSGAGKTTMIALLLRFFDPGAGRILLDGRDIREFELYRWRQMIAVALQNNPLLSGTLRDNLAYGRPSATLSEISAAVEEVGLSDFVDSLPSGLSTLLGEKGAKLSIGQAQRIGVARALLRSAPILLLDEPSSALDIATEQRLLRGVRCWLAERPRERLAIIVTHRQTAASWADRVYTICRGGLIEQSHGATRAEIVDTSNASSFAHTSEG